MPATHRAHLVQVGAPDPELKTSPIFDEPDDERPEDLEAESAVCYFNNAEYPIGSQVLSGNEVLSCQGRGVWVRIGEQRADEAG
jgi:hypothetical protein